MRVLWIFVGLLSTAFGIAGVVLPLVPTTPFLLVAAFAFARSSPRLHAMLLSHSTFGPIIENWNRGGCIDRRSKAFAIVMLVACILISLYLRVPAMIMVIQLVVLSVVAWFILSRPSDPAA